MRQGQEKEKETGVAKRDNRTKNKKKKIENNK